MPRDLWDVLVIGAGPAGLSAALALGRSRRRVAVLDDGTPRNRFSGHLQNVLGHDGTSPSRLLEVGREEVLRYGVVLVPGSAVGAARDDGFLAVRTGEGEVLRARRLIIATGLQDELPGTPGLAEHWGSGVTVCPYCDGWEARDGRLAELGTGPASVAHAQMLRQWSATVLYLPDGQPVPDGEEAFALAARGIEVLPGRVLEVRERPREDTDGDLGAAERLTGVLVVLESGREVVLDRLFLVPPMAPRDSLLRDLGAELVDHHGREYAGVHGTGRTSVPGVWAIGNVVDPAVGVAGAMGAGAQAAGSVNHDLVLEDVSQAVDAARRRRAVRNGAGS